MVSTVTGVVPSISFIREYLHSGQSEHHFYILEGASYHDEFGYDDELKRLSAEYPDVVTFIPTISRPDEARNSGWGASLVAPTRWSRSTSRCTVSRQRTRWFTPAATPA